MNNWVCRVGLVLLCVPLLLLTSCGEQVVVPPITDGFTCYADMTYQEMELKGKLTCGKDGTVQMQFDEPKSLKGITLRWDGNEMKMMLGEMSMSVPQEKVPQGALLYCLAQVMAADPKEGKAVDDRYVITGEMEGKTYELVCDPQTGTPLTLSIPEEELTATFTEFQSLKPEE